MRKRRQLIVGEATAIIETLSHDGRGIARIDGKATFIQGALPHETVVFQYVRRKRDFDEGQVVSILTPSVHRVQPNCAHYELCGGCSLQHMDPVVQIQEKQALFLNMLTRIGRCKPDEVLPALTASPWEYRNRARLSVRYLEKTQSVQMGFREKNNPQYITSIAQCPVLNKRVGSQLLNLRALIASFDSPAQIAQVEVAVGDDEVALILRNLAELSAADEDKLRAFAIAADVRIYLQPAGPKSVYLFYPAKASEFLSYHLPEQGVSFLFHPTDFTQINTSINRQMVSLALELLDLNEQDVVLDLFCGLGNFSLPMAKHAGRVMGIEGSETMVSRAHMNASHNGITNVDFFSANLDSPAVLDQLSQYKVSKLLLDPPRSGAFEIVKCIETLAPSRIVYVSCNPATLARDADILVNQKGYVMRKAGVMDMFPQSAHVESIVLFEKR